MLPRPTSYSNNHSEDHTMLRQGATPSETVPSESSSPESVRRGAVRRRSIALFCAALIISILAHLGSAVKLGTYHNNNPLVRPSSQSSKGVKMRIVTSQKSDPQVDKKDNLPLLEVKQQETLPPSEASHLGQVNHQTTKETRVSNTIPRPKGADAGAAGDSVQSRQPRSASVTQKQSASSESLDEVPKTRPKLTVGSSNVKVRSGQQRRQAYEAFLPSSFEELSGQVKVGYQDHLDDQLAEGDSIDINTREYRYIGYFTNMRKAIELVWNYPAAAARRRLEGETVLEFAIARNGSTSGIKVLESSGFDILDEGIVKAIRLASPFSPLPANLNKEQLVVTGSFRYVLQPFSAH